MIVGKVIGSIVSTVKHEAYRATKLMVVQPLGGDMEPSGSPFLAVDMAGAGEGEIVLIVREGHAARLALGVKLAPVRSLIIGIIDAIDTDAKSWRKFPEGELEK